MVLAFMIPPKTPKDAGGMAGSYWFGGTGTTARSGKENFNFSNRLWCYGLHTVGARHPLDGGVSCWPPLMSKGGGPCSWRAGRPAAAAEDGLRRRGGRPRGRARRAACGGDLGR